MKDKRVVDAFPSSSALNVGMAYNSLSDYNCAGSAVLLNRAAASKPTSIHYNLDSDEPAERYDMEGRVSEVG
jgi:hypothetical protein